MREPIFTGKWGACHIQGIAVDEKKGYIYYSFTTKLVKAKLTGEIVGYVDGLLGHLGCIALNPQDGKVYGALEYKSDAIGKGILNALKLDTKLSDAFYIARFDVDKINRPAMSAQEDGIMECIHLSEVVTDYHGKGKNSTGEEVPHRYGCSGIDGTTFAPLPGKAPQDGMYLYVAYGIYEDNSRDDNDHQVILCFDIADWDRYAAPLNQNYMHTQGPEKPLHKFFVYTGNTRYGIQNLEYDSYKNALFMAVYKGKKPQYPNYSLFAVNMTVPAEMKPLKGLEEIGECLRLLPFGLEDNGIYGWYFPHGSTGLCTMGDGRWYISQNKVLDGEQCGEIYQYRWDDTEAFIPNM